jgi:hypothetical protein
VQLFYQPTVIWCVDKEIGDREIGKGIASSENKRNECRELVKDRIR